MERRSGPPPIELNVRGQIPPELDGSLFVATNRRHKDRRFYSRWHDSQADLLRMDVAPGRPGRVSARFLSIDPRAPDLPGGGGCGSFYATQPNHGVNLARDVGWFTNLLYGAPLEVDLRAWRATRVVSALPVDPAAPQLSSTSHFATSLDRRYVYFHQSRLLRERGERPVVADALTLVRLDTSTGEQRTWGVIAPPDDPSLLTANFHSAFYFEEGGKRAVGLLKTGALIERLEPGLREHPETVIPMPASTIWTIEVADDREVLQAELLPGLREIGGIALSHLSCDSSSRDGFVLYANCKQAHVSGETCGENCYGEDPADVCEHYSGMLMEPFNVGKVIRYERAGGEWSIRHLERAYDFGRTSQGHTWLPINLEISPAREHVFATFAGFHPRLLPRHVADAYPGQVADMSRMRYVPPLVMRLRADTLEPDHGRGRSHLSYAESIAIATVGTSERSYLCTFSPEVGLRVYPTEDLQHVVAHATAADLHTWGSTHFRPDPAHMMFAALA